MNIGANAHGKWTVSTKQPQMNDILDHCWQLGFQWHQISIHLNFKSLDFHNATIVAATYVSGGGGGCFGVGALSSNVFTICLVQYTDF